MKPAIAWPTPSTRPVLRTSLFVLTRRGRRVAVLVDADDFARMSDLVENALDRAELEAARAENEYVPWEQVKADLGLT